MKLVRVDHGGWSSIGVDAGAGELLELREIIGIGRNYAEHAKERRAEVPDRPLVFTKNIASVVLGGEDVVVPASCRDPDTGGEQVDFEGELAVVIGRPARDVPAEAAVDCVLGYCIANDISARWWQKQGGGGQFWRGKSFDTFCPLGPEVMPADALGDPQSLAITTRVAGEVMQHGTTADMIFPVATLISELSRSTTLVPGTVILTGTPAGVGAGRTPPRWLGDGETVEVEIDRLGVLRNTVRFG